MTKQEMFDTVARHLLTQGRQSIGPVRGAEGETGCMYRGENGLKCAIGALIPDELYDPDMENICVTGLLQGFPRIRKLFPPDSEDFLDDLQIAHDEVTTPSPKEFRRFVANRLRKIAADYSLNDAVLNEFTTEKEIA